VNKRHPLVKGTMPAVLKQAERKAMYDSVSREIEERIERSFGGRHEYPMWPARDLEWSPMDAFEAQYHEQVRHVFYQQTIFLIGIARQLRKLEK